MTGLRILCVSVVSILCFLDARGVEGGVITDQQKAVATLQTVLNEAVRKNFLTEDNAKTLLEICAKQSLKKDIAGEILMTALYVAWSSSLIPAKNARELQRWAIKAYPEIFAQMEYLFVSKDARGVEGGVITDQQEAIATLKTVLNGAVNDHVLTEANAEMLLQICANGSLKKDTAGELLNEALYVAFENSLITASNKRELRTWAIKAYPVIFSPMEYVSLSKIMECLKTDDSSIESKLSQLSGEKIQVVEIAATVLEKACNRGEVTTKSAAEIVEEIIKSA